MKKNILFLFAWMCMLVACSEKGIMEYSDNTLYVYFATDATKDSTTYSFKVYPSGEIHVKIPMKCDGVWAREDQEYTVSADENFTTLPSDLYILPEKCVFPAGQLQDTIEIVLLDGDILKEKMCRLMLKVDETEFVKEGEVNYSRAIFLVSSKLVRPVWWTVWDGGYGGPENFYNIAEQIYLGEYSETKYTMFLEELAKDGVEFDGQNKLVLKKYSLRLKRRVEEFNNDPENIANGKVPLKDENGNKIVIPAVG